MEGRGEQVSVSRIGPWREEVHDFGRAVGGAVLFGVPLLYTMETWWIGRYADYWKLFAFLAVAVAANFGLTYFAGFKVGSTFRSTVNQTIDTIAVGILLSVVVLFVLNRINFATPLDSALGMIVIQTVPLSIGASIANAVFTPDQGGDETDDHEERHPWRDLLNDMGATAIGGVFIGMAIAPTAEISLLASELNEFHELALIALTFTVTYIIVFVSGFDPQQGRQSTNRGPFQRPLTETALSYVISLFVAFVALYLFDRVEISDPFFSILSQVVALGLPVAVGGAAGRLAV